MTTARRSAARWSEVGLYTQYPPFNLTKTDDADAVYEVAKAAGGVIIRELQNTDYGSREFAVKDPEGHSWSVGTYDPWTVPAS